MSATDVLITGAGVVSPIGIGLEAYAQSLGEQKSGVRELTLYDTSSMPVRFGGEVVGFDPKQYVKPRKSLKVMCREIQYAYASAAEAWQQAGLADHETNPERVGVVLGAELMYCDFEEMLSTYEQVIVDGKYLHDRFGPVAMSELHPLWMLKYLPNMAACHVSIALDARGPCNTMVHSDVSSHSAIAEAMRVIERGDADVMIAGGTASRIMATPNAFHGFANLSRRNDSPTEACRPYDADRDGMVRGEGAAAFVLESRAHAERRKANALARALAATSAFEPRKEGQPLRGTAIVRSLNAALAEAGVSPEQVGHVNTNGVGCVCRDAIEAQAIHRVLGEVPVTAPKSFFGSAGAATGALELVATIVALRDKKVPVTLNYEPPDPECPVNVVHAESEALKSPVAAVLNHANMGQAAALILTSEA